jgi:hypothetical protein
MKKMIDNVVITTNGRKRPLICGSELSAEERKEYDYMTESDIDENSFFRAYGRVFSLDEFMWLDTGATISDHGYWQGYAGDSYFSGVLVHYVDYDDCVIVAWYCE